MIKLLIGNWLLPQTLLPLTLQCSKDELHFLAHCTILYVLLTNLVCTVLPSGKRGKRSCNRGVEI